MLFGDKKRKDGDLIISVIFSPNKLTLYHMFNCSQPINQISATVRKKDMSILRRI